MPPRTRPRRSTRDRPPPDPSILSSSLPTYLGRREAPDIAGRGKRQAPFGQWKTPPTPMFVSGGEQAGADAVMMDDSPSMRRAGASCPDISSMGAQAFGALGGAAAGANVQALQMQAMALAAAQQGAAGGDASMMSGAKTVASCPDLVALYKRLQEEDDRRQRRLARNRASARARRQKKRNLVETYEREVTQLEAALKAVREREWGTADPSEAKQNFDEAMGTMTTSKWVTCETRSETAAHVLGAQAVRVACLEEEHDGSSALCWAGVPDGGPCTDLQRQLGAELANEIGLSQEQIAALGQASTSMAQEKLQLTVLAKCIAALRSLSWLDFAHIDTHLNAPSSVLNPEQLNKFLQWTQRNEEGIQMLNIVAGRDCGGEQPLFFFGDEQQ